MQRRLFGSLALFVLLASVGGPALEAEAADPYGAEGASDEDHPIHIPEPMVFDLVRGLGAFKGELEANVLGLVPLSDRGQRPFFWAPEVEFTIIDGLGIEFELGLEDDHLEAYKLAVQYTLGIPVEDRFIHGTQGIAEKFNGLDLWEFTLVYIPGFRFDRTWSVLAMIGARTETGADSANGSELLLNLSLFADLSANLSAGLETNIESGVGEDASVLLWPQIHWEITDHFMLQAGIGPEFRPEGTDTTFAFRFIYTR